MSQNKSLQSKMPLAMGLAFVAFTTQFGGGFASGAQIYQYFINYGIWCLILPAVTQGLYALFFWYGMRYAYKHKTYDYRSFSDSLYGKTKPVMSNLYEICYPVSYTHLDVYKRQAKTVPKKLLRMFAIHRSNFFTSL